MNPTCKVYLASGWFNTAQAAQMQEVYDVLSKLEAENEIELFAPYYDGIVLTKDDPNLRKKMRVVWTLDIAMVRESNLIVACTQDHDVGTIFECGYASAFRTPIICYNSMPELGLNVMLAQEARGFCKSKEDLEKALLDFVVTNDQKTWRWNLWKGVPI